MTESETIDLEHFHDIMIRYLNYPKLHVFVKRYDIFDFRNSEYQQLQKGRAQLFLVRKYDVSNAKTLSSFR